MISNHARFQFDVYNSHIVLISLLLLFNLFSYAESSIYNSDQLDDNQRVLSEDNCSNIWREDKLIGRCFGLKSVDEYKQGGVKLPENVNNPAECQDLCCKLGNSCVTWQVTIYIYIYIYILWETQVFLNC